MCQREGGRNVVKEIETQHHRSFYKSLCVCVCVCVCWSPHPRLPLSGVF